MCLVILKISLPVSGIYTLLNTVFTTLHMYASFIYICQLYLFILSAKIVALGNYRHKSIFLDKKILYKEDVALKDGSKAGG
jgi:hypothetical protein